MELQKLNPSQKKAVTTTEGRLLILAGAGSGKTSVLAHRIAYLIEEKKISPDSILGLTFTNKAAGEMRARVAEMVGKAAASKITLSTFHSFCMQILRKEIEKLGFTKKFTLYSETESTRLLTELIRQKLEEGGTLPSLKEAIEKIAFLKAKSTIPEDAASAITADHPGWHEGFTGELIGSLQQAMRAYNVVDFDSLLTLTLELLQKHPEVLAKYQERYRYVMIDEYQDTSEVQYAITSLIAAKHGNLCVVGDDDQSIYSWRGAEIKHILQFETDEVIKLEQNYRSTPTILQAANRMIRNNKERRDKELWSNGAPGEPIELFHAPTEIDEATAVIDRMVHYKEILNIPWSEIVILYRSNIHSRTFETALMHASWQKNGQWMRGIPYVVHGGTEFFERSEIKDLVAYLRVIANPFDGEALLRIINLPRRGISEQTLDKLTQQNRKETIPLFSILEKIANGTFESANKLSERALMGITGFVNLIKESQKVFSQQSLSTALSWFIEFSHFKKSIEAEVKSEKMRGFKWENVLQTVTALEEYEKQMEEDGKGEMISLSDFLSHSMLNRNHFEGKDEKKGSGVNLMTFHSAKGLEFSLCFLTCLEDHILPHEKSLGPSGIEEERRLFYVGMTRAKRQLVLSMAKERKRSGRDSKSSPSRFLFELPKELLKVTVWNERRW